MTSLHGYKETLTFDNSKLPWLAAGGRENGENVEESCQVQGECRGKRETSQLARPGI